MNSADEDLLTTYGSPRFGVSDENSDGQDVRNRIQSLKSHPSSFWIRNFNQTPAASSSVSSDTDIDIQDGRWKGDSSEENAGNSSLQTSSHKDTDDSSDDVVASDEVAASETSNGEGTIKEPSSSDAVLETSGDSESSASGATSSEPEHDPSDNEDVKEEEEEDRDEEESQEAQPMRFVWWNGNAAASNYTNEPVDITSAKRQAALDRLLDKLQNALEEGAGRKACIGILEAVKIVAADSGDSSSSETVGSRITGDGNDVRGRRLEKDFEERKSRHRDHSRRSGSRKKRREPSNRQLQQGLLALSQLIEAKMSQSSTSETSTSPETSYKDSSSSSKSDPAGSSFPSSGSASGSHKFVTDPRVAQLELDCMQLRDTINELQALADAQSAHLKSTLTTLESTEKERQEVLHLVSMFKENDKVKSECMMVLKAEVKTLEDQLEKLGDQKEKAETAYCALETELKELNGRFEMLRQQTNEGKAAQVEVSKLRSENEELEQDLVKMVECCSEYKKVIEELKSRVVKRRPKHQSLTFKLSIVESESVVVRQSVACQVTLPDAPGRHAASSPLSRSSSVSVLGGPGECSARLQAKLQRLEEERGELDELLYLAREEKRLLKSDVARLTSDLRKREQRVAELEFMLECEAEYQRRQVPTSLECKVESSGETLSTVDASRESFGWLRNVFGRNTPTFGNSCEPVPR